MSDSEEDFATTVRSAGSSVSTKVFNGTERLLEELKSLINDEKTADVKFIARDSAEPVRAHKLILSLRSEVFRTMFFGAMRESMSECAEVEVPDVSREGLKTFLDYLYSGIVEITTENVLELMHMSHKYSVTSLQTACTTYVQVNITAENSIQILKSALMLDDEALVSICMKAIEQETSDAIQQPSFLEISKDELLTILQNMKLNIEELELFRRVVDWCNANSLSAGDDAEEVMKHIRFGALSGQELIQHVKPCPLVPRELYYEALEKQFAVHQEPKSRKKCRQRRSVFKF